MDTSDSSGNDSNNDEYSVEFIIERCKRLYPVPTMKEYKYYYGEDMNEKHWRDFSYRFSDLSF